ncbi:MAG: tRNA (guanosine(37)-N1)-methyltransferase TrmD, partial [Oscillospiraceae bacterium]
MRIDIVTLFPEMCEAFLGDSIVGRARKSQKIEINCHQLRDFSDDKWRRVDDTPYGGGQGMIIRAEPLTKCCEHIIGILGKRPHIIYLSPRGRVFNQGIAGELLQQENLLLICGHYEGVDE